MKKIKFCIFYSLISLLAISESAFANNKGYYFDASIASNRVNHQINSSEINQISPVTQNRQTDKNRQNPYADNVTSEETGFSLKIGNKITNVIFDNFFISPGISYERINNDITDSAVIKYTINDRIVADIAFGLDVTSKLSTYASVGFADLSYEVDANNVTYPVSIYGEPLSTSLGSYENRESSIIYGAGIKYQARKNLYLLLEYSRQDVNLHSEHKAVPGGVTLIDMNSKIESVKIGISKNL